MFTTLDAKPQEWMQGDSTVLHTVAACHFTSPEHAEHWINLLVPKNRDGKSVKWAGGRRKDETRSAFLSACIEHASEFDFTITCVSSNEGEMNGKFLSDNFCNDEVGPGSGKARGVAFVNDPLGMRDPKPQISLPTNNRSCQLDLLSDHFCGLANTVWSGAAPVQQTADFNKLEQLRPDVIENIRFATDLRIVDQNGVDVTAQVKAAVAKGSVDG